MKAELFDFLKADVAVAALVNDRIFAIKAPESADYPSVTITRVNNNHENNMLGSSGLSRATYQIDTWALSSPSAESVSDALRDALDGFRGDMGGVDVRSIFLVADEDIAETPKDGSQNFIFRTRQDYTINHRESIPTFP